MKNVILVKTDIKRYRLSSYALLIQKLLENRVKLVVYYTDATAKEIEKGDNVQVLKDGGFFYRSIRIFNGRVIIYLISLKRLIIPDLVILVQSNAHILNIFIILLRRMFRKRTALWGHTRNFQAPSKESYLRRILEAYRVFVNRTADYWFSYTSKTTDDLIKIEFDQSKIKTINNSIELKTPMNLEDKFSKKGELNVLYCGALYAEKQVDFALYLAKELEGKPIRFTIAGSGPIEAELKKLAKSLDLKNVEFVGRIDGEAKHRAFMQADLTILPGLVGLGILESFYYGAPLLTLSSGKHSPEIAYFENEYNGLYLSEDVVTAAKQVLKLISLPHVMQSLQTNCVRSYEKYSHKHFVQNIVDGIVECLKL